METIELRISIPKNNKEDLVKEEAFEVLNYFKSRIEGRGENPTNDIVCIISTKQGAERHEVDKCYNEDAIRIAVEHIKGAGFFVWFNRDYKGQGSYWITTRENQPHQWYRLLK